MGIFKWIRKISGKTLEEKVMSPVNPKKTSKPQDFIACLYLQLGLGEELEEYFSRQPEKEKPSFTERKKLLDQAYSNGIKSALEKAEEYASLGLLEIEEGINVHVDIMKKEIGIASENKEGNKEKKESNIRMMYESQIAFFINKAREYARKIDQEIPPARIREIWKTAYATFEAKADYFIDIFYEKEREAQKSGDKEEAEYYRALTADYYFPIWEKYSSYRKQLEQIENQCDEDTKEINPEDFK